MFRAVLVGLAASGLLPVLAATIQVPLVSDRHASILRDDDRIEWALDKSPSPDTTDHLVFETVHSLLQHWPNTCMRNGHTIVPGIIPQGTLLYHGRFDHEISLEPEWMALDPEHAHVFCRIPHLVPSPQQRECWQITFVASRPLKIVYFDGNSAATIPYGTMDTQDHVVCGDSPPGLWDDPKRAECLCGWGKNFGVDSFDGNVIVVFCDFTSGVDIISFSNLAQPLGLDESHLLWDAVFESLVAGTWHNRFPGETRIQLDLTELISFYDTQLVPSLVPTRANQERWDHRVQNASYDDVAAVMSRLEAALARPSWRRSKIDWQTLLHVIVDRFAERLALTRHLLHSPYTHPDDILDLARKAHTQLRTMLTPYILFSATPTDPLDTSDLDWTVSVYKLCATTHTHFLDAEAVTDAERLLLRAARGTTREICRVVTTMWAAGVYAGLDALLNTHIPDVSTVTRVWEGWAVELDQLMRWLDWSVWVKCMPECGPEELCYLPTWPVNFPCSPLRRKGCEPVAVPDPANARVVLKAIATGKLRAVGADADAWIRPQSTCIRRFDPLELEM